MHVGAPRWVSIILARTLVRERRPSTDCVKAHLGLWGASGLPYRKHPIPPAPPVVIGSIDAPLRVYVGMLRKQLLARHLMRLYTPIRPLIVIVFIYARIVHDERWAQACLKSISFGLLQHHAGHAISDRPPLVWMWKARDFFELSNVGVEAHLRFFFARRRALRALTPAYASSIGSSISGSGIGCAMS